MRKFVATAALCALAACGEPAAEPTPVATAVAEPVEPSLPAPDQEIFAEAFAAACPAAENVSTSSCRAEGMGAKTFLCEYGLGDDEYLRHRATLVPGDAQWTLAEPETTCAQGAD